MVEVVVHSAANVKHYGAYEEFYQDNVLGTERLLEFALNQKKKDFHFVSTVDVGRGDIPGKDYLLFTEYCLDEGQQSPFVYGKSKFEAEKKVVAYREKGLNTSIYRAGNMTFNSQTGKFQENIHDNFTYSMMKTLIKVGFWSDRMRNLQLDLSFVDLAARAIVLLLTRKSLKNEIYHISNPNTMSWLEMASQLEKSGIEVQELKEHRNHVAKFESDSELGKLVERVKLYSWIWEESETRTVPRGVRTVALLNQIGFQWPEVSTQHLEKMIDHCKNVGFL
jgi:thioester reductase-like protein